MPGTWMISNTANDFSGPWPMAHTFSTPVLLLGLLLACRLSSLRSLHIAYQFPETIPIACPVPGICLPASGLLRYCETRLLAWYQRLFACLIFGLRLAQKKSLYYLEYAYCWCGMGPLAPVEIDLVLAHEPDL